MGSTAFRSHVMNEGLRPSLHPNTYTNIESLDLTPTHRDTVNTSNLQRNRPPSNRVIDNMSSLDGIRNQIRGMSAKCFSAVTITKLQTTFASSSTQEPALSALKNTLTSSSPTTEIASSPSLPSTTKRRPRFQGEDALSVEKALQALLEASSELIDPYVKNVCLSSSLLGCNHRLSSCKTARQFPRPVARQRRDGQ